MRAPLGDCYRPWAVLQENSHSGMVGWRMWSTLALIYWGISLNSSIKTSLKFYTLYCVWLLSALKSPLVNWLNNVISVLKECPKSGWSTLEAAGCFSIHFYSGMSPYFSEKCLMPLFTSAHSHLLPIGLPQKEGADHYPLIYSQIFFFPSESMSYNSLRPAQLDLFGFVGWVVHEPGLPLTSQEYPNFSAESLQWGKQLSLFDSLVIILLSAWSN